MIRKKTIRKKTIRKFAMKVLNAAARHAAPGTRDWVNAMSREMDFIENDWAALWWALGSTRILFKRQYVPLADLSGIPRAAQCLTKTVRRRTISGLVITLTEAVFFGYFFFGVSTAMLRIGSALTVAAMLYMAYQLYARRAAQPPLDTASATFAYRVELERQREFHCGSWFWSRFIAFLPGPILFCVGAIIAQPESARAYATILAGFVVLSIWAVQLNLSQARKYQRRLDELEALQR
ncbi:MAG TPA: hypothetical protein VN950_04250 [Terriglobales bacterium]|nr:hypothetical protein [Terriglobales bacterium]